MTPPLPEPNVEIISGHREPFISYDKEQMQEYDKACRDAAMSEIAKERDALMAAAKMALDALSDERYVARYSQITDAIEALKKAGVTP